MKEKWVSVNRIIARVLYMTGKIPHYSTGIHGGLTKGYGELDEYGFYQYPLPLKPSPKEAESE